MTVTEAKMAWGDFTIPLRKDTPREILAMLKLEPGLGQTHGSAFGFIRIFPHRISADVVKSTRSRDMFCGVIQDQATPYEVSGHHVTMMLGENSGSLDPETDEHGPIASTSPIAFDGSTAGSLTQWTFAALGIPQGMISLGSVLSSLYASGTLRPGIFIRKTPRTILDNFVCHEFGVVWRVTNSLTLDIGLTTDVWPTGSPPPIAVRRGGRDLNIQGLNAVELGLATSYQDYATRVLVHLSSPDSLGEAYQSSIPFNNLDGTQLNWSRVVSGSTSGPSVQRQADTQIKDTVRTRTISLQVDEYAPTADMFDLSQPVAPGYLIYCYDVEQGIFDMSNRIHYLGKTLHPALLRVESVQWPIKNGLGVFFDNRHNTGRTDVTDLTDFVEWESGPSTITVGAPQRTLGRALRLKHR